VIHKADQMELGVKFKERMNALYRRLKTKCFHRKKNTYMHILRGDMAKTSNSLSTN
jgi:hypothetical protein